MEQKIRAALFYTSVVLFFILLPLVLLYSFGYKFDFSKFHFAKTGLIYIKTAPDGARVYLNNRYLARRSTPLSIEGLMPGRYKVALEFKGYYPWQQEVLVQSGQTAYLEDIILFPKKPYLEKVNILDIGNFYVFSIDPDYAYCISEDRTALYKASLNTKDQEVTLLCEHQYLPLGIKELSLSPDKKKVLFFNNNRLDVIYLPTEKLNYERLRANNFFVLADAKIWHAFWYSDSDRIIVITEKSITIYELLSQGRGNTISALKLRDNRTSAFYDTADDILYFTDIQKGSDDKWHRGLYRLDMGRKSPFAFIKNIEENLK